MSKSIFVAYYLRTHDNKTMEDLKCPELPDLPWAKIWQEVKAGNTERRADRMRETNGRLMVALNLAEKDRHEARHNYMGWLELHDQPDSHSANQVQLIHQILRDKFHRLMSTRTNPVGTDIGVTRQHFDGDELTWLQEISVEAYMHTLLELHKMSEGWRPGQDDDAGTDYNEPCMFLPEHKQEIQEASIAWMDILVSEGVGAVLHQSVDRQLESHFYKDEKVGILLKNIISGKDDRIATLNKEIERNFDLLEVGPLYPPCRFARDTQNYSYMSL